MLGVLAALIAAVQRGIDFCQSLLRVLLSQRVHLLDSRQGAHARARAVRGLGVLRQAEPRAPRGVGAAAVAREPHVRARAERHRDHELRGAAAALLAVGGRDSRDRGAARVHRRDEVLGRALPRVPVAQPGSSNARVSRDRARARGPREGGEALRSRAAAHGSLPRDLQAHLRRGAQAHAAAHGLGLRARPRERRGVLRRVRVDRDRDRARRDHARRDDDVPHAVPPGPIRGRRDAVRDRRHVRGQSLSLEPLRLPRAAARCVARRRRCERARRQRPASSSSTCASRTRAPRPPRSQDLTLKIAPGQSVALVGSERLGQDDAREAARRALRAGQRHDPLPGPRT